MARYFTVAEAERLLPAVERAIREAIRLKTDYQDAEVRLNTYLQRLAQLGGVVADRDAVTALKTRRDESAAALRGAIENIHEYGCEVKDLDIGLIDFRCYYRNEEVYLCWKLGEHGITWWHGLQDGFRGRRPIDEEFLKHHRGERPQ
jgi:hypothetical protein